MKRLKLNARLMPLAGLITLTLLVFAGCQFQSSRNNDQRSSVHTATPPSKASHREYNDVARFLAGLPPEEGSRLTEASARPAFAKYAAAFDKSWKKLNGAKLDAMKTWAAEEMPEISRGDAALFYPFSGPDFLHAYTFFPGAGRYVLVALEPVGSLPKIDTMTPDAVDQLFASVDRSLDTVINFSFFKTDNMKIDMKKEVDGALPILMVFLARTGNRITEIRPIDIDKDGNVTPQAPQNATGRSALKGVEILFQPSGSMEERRLEYFSVNLQNDYLKKSPAFLQYVDKLGPVNTYLKSASYLMYKSYFSTIRQAILDRSAFVLEDDSAIPYRYFARSDWDVDLYGVYSRPIEMFKEHQQPDLAAAYKGAGATKPLPFGIGYSWRPGQSNLLTARKMAHVAPEEANVRSH